MDKKVGATKATSGTRFILLKAVRLPCVEDDDA
jgi:hypothetical protein